MKKKKLQLTGIVSTVCTQTGLRIFVVEAGDMRISVSHEWLLNNNPRPGGLIAWDGRGDPEYSPPPVAALPTKVTRESLEARIKAVDYVVMPDGRTTICQLTMVNGFTIRGESSCVSIENFDKSLGEKYAYQRAIDAAWGFEGYLLADRRYEESLS